MEVWGAALRDLHACIKRLEPGAQLLEVPFPRGREWYELLQRKLLPQVEGPPLLVAAVVGGTNIGKSAIFNQLVGEEASGVSPMAAGTKHPVCLAPPHTADEAALAGLFEGFTLRAWQAADEPLAETADDPLFWRVGQGLPPRLLALDTPDIDSDAEVNWQRADYIRRAADVLIAVLTQQKYNDAAVKRFFRAAADADKTVVVIFNQCHLEGDRQYWPKWLATFCEGTGIKPHSVLVAPHDRDAVARRQLPFYDVGVDGLAPPERRVALADELSHLAFDEIKRRALRGAAMQVVDERTGAPASSREIREASERFAAANQAITSVRADEIVWPPAPAAILKDEIRKWWDTRRPAWTLSIHGAYRWIGQMVVQAGRTAAAWLGADVGSGASLDQAYESYQAQEREAILRAVGQLVDKLQGLADVGTPSLAERLKPLVTGEARARLIERVNEAHNALEPVTREYRAYLRDQLELEAKEYPRFVRVLESLDQALAVARPVITLALMVGGAALVAPAVPMTHAMVDAAVTVGAGEALAATSGAGLQRAAALLFQRLQDEYARRRGQWLGEWLEREYLGEVRDHLGRGASIASSRELAAFDEAIRQVRAAFEEK